MYFSNEEKVHIAKVSWETAQKALDKLGRQMDRVENRNSHVCSVQYVLDGEEIETIRVQYAALAVRVDELWKTYQNVVDAKELLQL